jgi:ketosteroid isomerase-like protein
MNQQKEIDIIRQARENSNASILKQDVAGIAQYWMEDMIVISGEGGQYLGKDVLIDVFKEMFGEDPPVFERIPTAIIIGESGILAWETGTWNYKTAPYSGNYSAMWRKVRGKWMTQSELFVSLD